MLLNRKIMFLIAFVSLFLCMVSLQDTYAKYTSAIDETTDIAIARWRILVNDFDIRSNSSTTNLITPSFSGNTNIASGVIAPTATGSIQIDIDASGTDLAFNYSIAISNSVDSPVSDILVNSCTMDGVSVNVNNGTVTGTYPLSDARTKRLICQIEWFDGTGENMNNAADTATTTLEESVAKLSVVINFTQIGSATPTPTPTASPEPNEP